MAMQKSASDPNMIFRTATLTKVSHHRGGQERSRGTQDEPPTEKVFQHELPARLCDVFKVFLGRCRKMGRIVTQYYRCAENITHIPFVDPVTVVVCDHRGIDHTLVGHGIRVRVPEGAIPKGKVVHFELAVALYGPFSFPNNTRPVSPILWLCPQEETEFQKPIQVTLPHFLIAGADQLAQLGVRFAKADHNDFSGSKKCRNVKFDFQGYPEPPQFSVIGKQGVATMETTHCCFMCLTADQCPQLAREAGFLFSRISYISLSSTSVVCFCVSFYLPTCLKVLNGLFRLPADKRFSQFKFTDGSDPHLEIVIQDQEKYLTDVYPKHRKIKMSDVDFWAEGCNEVDMFLRHQEDLYPPRVTVNWVPVDEHVRRCAISFKVIGCVDGGVLDSEVVLPLVARLPSTPLLLTGTADNSCTSQLNEREHLKICEYLQQLEEDDIILLGQALGLLRSKLKKMKKLPNDMIDAWLIGADDVLHTSGCPTWERLCTALRVINKHWIAADIERKA